MSELQSFKLSTSNNTEIPLKSVLYEIDVCNQVCQFTVSQMYTNAETVPIEAYYTFPMMANSAVYDFHAIINDKVIKTQIKPKEVATKEYNNAIKDGHKAFLMEKVDGDTFSICIGNLEPNSNVKIQIRCCLELSTEIDSTQIRLCIPMTIMPKYTPKTAPSLMSSILNSIMRTDSRPYDLTVKGHIYVTDGITSLDSKTHSIKISDMLPNELNFVVTPDELNTDIVLSIKRNQPKTFILTSKFHVEESEGLTAVTKIPENSEFMFASQVNIIPDFSKVPEYDVKSSSYIIILDSSGSMEGADFKNCIDSGIIFVSSLPFESKFNVYNFSDSFHKFSNEPVTVTSDSKQEAVKWMNKIICRGGTEVLPVLQDVYKTLNGQDGIIVFLSDGGVSNTNDVIKLVKKNKNISVYTIGIGQSVSQQLIKDMASQSVGGVSEFINNSNDELEVKVLAQLNRAQQNMRKCLKNNKIVVNTNGAYKLVPELTLLYEGDVNVFYIFSNQLIESVTYSQYGPDNLISSSTTVQPSMYFNLGNSLHRLGGIKLLNELYANENNIKYGSQIPHLKMDVNADENKISKDQIINVSQTLGVLSKYTAFIGVEMKESSSGVAQIPLLRQVPLQTAKKYNTEGCASFGGSYGIKSMSAACAMRGSSKSVSKSNSRFVDCRGGSSSEEEDDCGGNPFGDSPPNTFNVNQYLPQSVNNSWFGGSSIKKIDFSIDGNESIMQSSPIRPGGANTVGSSKKNASYDIRGSPSVPKFVSKPWSKDPPFENTRVTPGMGLSFSKSKSSIVAKYVVKTKLPSYDILGKLLSGKINSALPFAKDVNVDDYIELTMEGSNNGIYKIIKLGSVNTPWVLKKM